ncbi:MAG TPA: TlpA disulfide reductase family protein [Burkholderiales bacterium]|nr:TlpA disulfide reductase family protein [Burkholderiales bacterium]
MTRAVMPDVFSRVADRPRAPDFSLEDLDRKLWRLSDLSGRVVLVNFWASWCPPCRRELPSLESLYRAAGPKGVIVLGINAGESWDTVAAFTAGLEPQITFPVLMDEKGSMMHAWQVKALPATYVVDRNSRIVLRALGGRDFSRPDAIEDVSRLAGEN